MPPPHGLLGAGVPAYVSISKKSQFALLVAGLHPVVGGAGKKMLHERDPFVFAVQFGLVEERSMYDETTFVLLVLPGGLAEDET